MTDLQRLYGLVVASEFPLHQDRPVPAGTPVDVHIRWGEPRRRREQSIRPEGRVLLEATWSRRTEYAFIERMDGSVLLRFVGACDAEVSADLSDVVVHPVEGADPGIAVVLTTGAILAFQLYRRGGTVLHASAVEVGGQALAFVAPSGGGKSTMATLLCADGAGLITDDVLAVDHDLTVRLGATGLRLRKGADVLVDLFGDSAPDRRRSADDRQVLSPRPATTDSLPLAALVVPFPDRRLRHVRVERREAKNALFDLLSFPRLLGWQDPGVLGAQLRNLATLVADVPVYQARVPWGPPFSPLVAAELRAAIPELAPIALRS
jgi:hypothetical protein